jgi:hypothetical protein
MAPAIRTALGPILIAFGLALGSPALAQPLELQDEEAGPVDSLLAGDSVKIYGFGDVNYRHMLVPDDSPWLLYLNRHPSVFVGHLNMYLDAQLSERWRALTEIRFTYSPHGAWRTDGAGLATQDDTSAADYADFTRDHPVGSIMIERAWVEYGALPFLSIQAGQFLTPYGIWNVDHGSPVIIGVTPPFIIGAELLPAQQVGILAHGSVDLVDDLELGYALGLSNGRTNFSAYEDMDDSKAVTARLSATHRGLGELTLGATAYFGRNTRTTRQIYFVGTSPKSRENIVDQYDELAYAADLKWVYAGLHLQTEWLANERRYTEAGRPLTDGGLEADRRDWGGYALVGYRTPLLGIMPYVKGEYSPDPALRAIGVQQNVALVTGGLNVRPVPRVVLKGEYTYGTFPDAPPGSFAENDIQGVDLQLAWAF